MAITLNGHAYEVDHKAYQPSMSLPKSAALGMTGTWLIVETLKYPKEYVLTLQCTLSELSTLRADYALGGLLTMTDEESVTWNASGSGAGHLNTGVFFSPDTKIATNPYSELAMTTRNRFLQPVKLIVNDTTNTLP